MSVPHTFEDIMESVTSLEKAEIKFRDLDLVIPHGACTPLSDKYEARTFKEHCDGFSEDVSYTALKPYLGHNLGGNVLLETAALMMMFEQNCILPTLNVDEDSMSGIKLITTAQNQHRLFPCAG